MDAPATVATLFKTDGRVVITAEARTNPNPPGSSPRTPRTMASTPRTLIITGAGHGIGAAIALKAGLSEYRAVVNYAKDQRGADQVVDQIRASGGNAVSIGADILNSP